MKKLIQVFRYCKLFITDKNWPSNYTYPGRYHDIGITDRVLEYIKLSGKTNLKILDVGCSIGLAAKEMKNEIMANHKSMIIEITGMDVKINVKNQAKLNLDNFILGDILKTNIPHVFDIVICSRMMLNEYAYRKSLIVKKITEFVKDDGCLVTDCYSYKKRQNKKVSFKQELKDMWTMLESIRYGWKSFQKEMERARLREMKRFTIMVFRKESVLDFSERIILEWKKLNPILKGLEIFGICISKLLIISSSKKPRYKRPFIKG